jgi:hypothetical protein
VIGSNQRKIGENKHKRRKSVVETENVKLERGISWEIFCKNLLKAPDAESFELPFFAFVKTSSSMGEKKPDHNAKQCHVDVLMQ